MLSTADRITESLRQQIAGMAAGVPLPPVPQLMRDLRVGRSTIDRAYDTLEARGLIQRKHRKGVFTADPLQTGELAIVFRASQLSPQAQTPFHSIASSMLIHRMHSHNPRWVMRMHLGSDATQTGQEEFARLLDLMHPDVLPRLRGVFTFNPLFDLEQQLMDAGVPVVSIHKGRARHVTYFDELKFFQGAAAFAQAEGYRRVGVVARLENNDQLTGLLRARGIEVREGWRIDAKYQNSELVAFEGLSRVWLSGDRPEAIIVGEDVACRGVLRAAGQLGIRLGAELKLVTVSIHGVELPWQSPITRYEFDPAQLVDAAARQMTDLLHNRSSRATRVLVPAAFVPGAST